MKWTFCVYAALLAWLIVSRSQSFAADNLDRGFVETPTARNIALMAGVPINLPGIDLDLNNVQKIAGHSGYQFQTKRLWSGEAKRADIARELQSRSAKVGEKGTFFFYFSGHGSPGSLNAQDGAIKIGDMRRSLEQGRMDSGPMGRLIMMFDSCFSGSLLDPVRKLLGPIEEEAQAHQFAQNLVEEFSESNRDRAYWNSLFIFASSRSNETSDAGKDGSAFTVALKKAYDELLPSNGTLKEWVERTKRYTNRHHPVERFSPSDVANETLVR